MKKILYTLLTILYLTTTVKCFHVDNVGWSSQRKNKTQQDFVMPNFFKQAKPAFGSAYIVTDPLFLLQAAKDVLRCLQSRQAKNDCLIAPVGFESIIPLDNVIKTLEYIVEVIEQDAPKKKFRILDPAFLENNFACVQWNADRNSAQANGITLPNDGSIRLTSYGIWTVSGSEQKTAAYPCGLYKLLDESIGKKYTKHQILEGALEQSENRCKRKALAWVCRQDLEDALMQGTVVVKFPKGSYKILNVHKTNGIVYNRNQKDVWAQERYWFFKDIAPDAFSKKQALDRFTRRKEVVFAGDLCHIGLGKLIAIRHNNPISKKLELRLGILADTGGAFDNNLYQLDLFSGFFENKDALKKHLYSLPSATQACILYKK